MVPQFLEFVDLQLQLNVLLVIDGKDWPLRDHLLHLLIEVVGNALSKLGSPLNGVVVGVVEAAVSGPAKILEDLYDGFLDLIQVESV